MLMVDAEQLKGLSAEQLHEVTLRLIDGFADQQRLLEAKDRSIEALTREVTFKSTKVDQLTHELAQYKRPRFGKSSKKLDAAQASLLEETPDADLAAIEEELKQLRPSPKTEDKQQPRRTSLSADLPRVDVHHEPESTTCTCGCALKRIGEDVVEKLDYAIFGRAGLAISRSTLGARVGACGVRLQPLVDALKEAILDHHVLHADETPVAMLKPCTGKTHRAYLWAYTSGAFEGMKAVVYDFADSRAGQHAQDFLGEWRGALVCDDYSGYKALLANGVVEAGCLAHAPAQVR